VRHENDHLFESPLLPPLHGSGVEVVDEADQTSSHKITLFPSFSKPSLKSQLKPQHMYHHGEAETQAISGLRYHPHRDPPERHSHTAYRRLLTAQPATLDEARYISKHVVVDAY